MIPFYAQIGGLCCHKKLFVSKNAPWCRALGCESHLFSLVIYKDPSDMGNLKVIADFMNPGNHDEPPSAEQIKVAHGNLNKFRKSYFSGAPSWKAHELIAFKPVR